MAEGRSPSTASPFVGPCTDAAAPTGALWRGSWLAALLYEYLQLSWLPLQAESRCFPTVLGAQTQSSAPAPAERLTEAYGCT